MTVRRILLAGVLNLSQGQAKARAEQAGLLAPRRSLTGETLPPTLPATATELAAGAIGPTHVRVITATMRRIPPSTHLEVAAHAEQLGLRGGRAVSALVMRLRAPSHAGNRRAWRQRRR